MATLVVVVAAFPLVFLWAVHHQQRTGTPSLAKPSRVGDAADASAVVVNPLGPCLEDAVTAGNEAATGANAASPLVAPFLSDYRPGAWYTRHADLALTLLLAALQVGICVSCIVHADHPRQPQCRP